MTDPHWWDRLHRILGNTLPLSDQDTDHLIRTRRDLLTWADGHHRTGDTARASICDTYAQVIGAELGVRALRERDQLRVAA